MTLLGALLMGLLQGLTEFIPVSSSGHLAILDFIFDQEAPLFLDVFVHLATLLATLIVFREQCFKLLRAGKYLPAYLVSSLKQKRLATTDNPNLYFLVLVLISFFVTGCLALLIKDHIEFIGQKPIVLACLFILNGFILLSSRYARSGHKNIKQLNIRHAIWVGLAQAFAVLPGISRSGSCIASLMHLKAERKLVGDYAFILSIPTIFAAFILTLQSDLSSIQWTEASVAFITAFISGFFALKFLLRWIQQGKLWIFSFYSFLLGIVLLVLQAA
ncbi:MAG TPA: undecaprenyl-diphosphate phosphatase [Oligoflexia bacterium]|nr:undecaprenyl-diphosphate phosphatase [Oligoflexia bacterium]HMR25393.1 undecaprenyl-diphosphate phosphatase [Oligoflexia bacterium]